MMRNNGAGVLELLGEENICRSVIRGERRMVFQGNVTDCRSSDLINPTAKSALLGKSKRGLEIA